MLSPVNGLFGMLPNSGVMGADDNVDSLGEALVVIGTFPCEP